MKIAVLEDDIEQANLLIACLQTSSNQCTSFQSSADFIRSYIRDSFDLIILDWEIPKMSGFKVLKHVRDHIDANVPIIFITHRANEDDIVAALENGADDYIIKPIKKNVMLARIQAVTRRFDLLTTRNTQNLHFSPYKINTDLRHICYNDKVIAMTQKEYELALFLFKNLGRIISRSHLLEMIWGTSATINTRTVDTHISRLRVKLNLDNECNWKLNSVYRQGYRLEKLHQN